MGTESVRALFDARLEMACDWPDPRRDELVRVIRQRHGPGVRAVLVYGSYLRGKRDTLLDFYVLLDRYRAMRPAWHAALAWLLSPNVYQVAVGDPPEEARAKYALMTLSRFERAVRHDFHPYFWARFVQPSGLLYCSDPAVRVRIIGALAQAARRFVATVTPRLDDTFNARDLVVTGLGLTYGCELRTEAAGQTTALFEQDAVHYEALLASLASADCGFHASTEPGAKGAAYRNESGRIRWAGSAMAWWARRMFGKLKSVLRLAKAALTFDGGFEYLLWKIRRHSGEYIEPTERQRRHPLLFAWPLLWRLYRRGAFR